MNYREKVFALVKQIPAGKVTTYGQLANAVGLANSRLIGGFLHQNSDPKLVPCHRVVNRFGGLATGYAFGGQHEQAERLINEGVIVTDNQVDLTHYGWVPSP